jgi:hypothetical protein
MSSTPKNHKGKTISAVIEAPPGETRLIRSDTSIRTRSEELHVDTQDYWLFSIVLALVVALVAFAG